MGLVVGLAALLLSSVAARQTGFAVVCSSLLEWHASSDPVPEGCEVVGRASFEDQSTTASGFGKLHIKTVWNESTSDDVENPQLQYRAAGFMEGYLTAERIWQHFQNMKAYFENQLYPGVDIWGFPMDFLARQEVWLHDQLQDADIKRQLEQGASGSEPLNLLSAVHLLNAQFEGLREGYAARCADEPEGSTRLGNMQRVHHYFMQNNGELYDIVDAWLAGVIGPDISIPKTKAQQPLHDPPKPYVRLNSTVEARGRGGRASLSASEWFALVTATERCSAVIKATGDLSDLLMGHATFDSFTNILRIFKHYDLGGPGSGRLSFSSYPGETFSDDDFYLSQSGLVVLETTNHVFDATNVYLGLSPNTLLSWQRVRGALMVASSGEEWVKAFSTHNSGTYNNQYMVVDIKRFVPGEPLQAGLLWVAEQLPSVILAMDVTDILGRGYWASYNVPFFEQVYDLSGYPNAKRAIQEDQAAHQDEQQRLEYELPIRWLQYQISPRANMFRRDQGQVSGLEEFKKLIRYNNYLEDPYSGGQPLAAICGRADLAPVNIPQHTATGATAEGTAVPGTGAALTSESGGVAWSRRALLTAGKQRTAAGLTVGKRDERVQHPRSLVAREPRGCYDSKVTSAKLAKSLLCEVISGPTTSHGLPPFSWADWSKDNYSYVGHPTEFNFAWERMDVRDMPLD